MILYIYDHCPYCVKARMIFGLKNQAFQIKTLLNDDEQTPIKMIGVKMVPILEYETGKFMPESMDIVDFIDKKNSPALVESSEDSELMAWISQNNPLTYKLAMPRWIQAPLEEFKTDSARDYFEKKKTAYIGSFEENRKDSPLFISQIEKELNKLEGMIDSKLTYFKENLSLNDFHLFPFLRSLSVVKGLNFPPKVKNYMEKLSKLSQTPLHFDIAL